MFMRHKEYVTENTSSKWRHNKFPFSSPTLSKILVGILVFINLIQIKKILNFFENFFVRFSNSKFVRDVYKPQKRSVKHP